MSSRQKQQLAVEEKADRYRNHYRNRINHCVFSRLCSLLLAATFLNSSGCLEANDNTENFAKTSSRSSSQKNQTTKNSRKVSKDEVDDTFVGVWERVTPPYKGMLVRVHKSKRGYFGIVVKDESWHGSKIRAGDLKWKNVERESNSLLTLKDLVVNTSPPYRTSHIQLRPGRLTLLSANKQVNGGFQVWEKIGYRHKFNPKNVRLNVKGTWSGTYTDREGTKKFTLKLDQTGTRVLGTAKMNGRSRVVVGDVIGETLSLRMIQHFDTLYGMCEAVSTLKAKLNDSTLKGTDSGYCTCGPYYDGRFSVTRE